jgi:hypothetical protein
MELEKIFRNVEFRSFIVLIERQRRHGLQEVKYMKLENGRSLSNVYFIFHVLKI